MKAEQAKLKAEKAREKAIGKQKELVKDILGLIDKHAEKGKFELFYRGHVHPVAWTELEKLNYVLRTITHRNEVTTNISWE